MNIKLSSYFPFQNSTHLLIACCIIILSLSGCSLFSGENSDPDFNENYKKWQQHNLSDYTFTLNQYCFCNPDLYPAQIIVKDKKISQVLDPESQEPMPIDSTQTYSDIYLTIDDLFDLIKGAIEEEADQLDVRYDNKYGFPQDIGIDYDKNVADEEMGYEITYFRTDGSSQIIIP